MAACCNMSSLVSSSVVGETVDDVKRRIVGPEGIPIEVTLRHKRHVIHPIVWGDWILLDSSPARSKNMSSDFFVNPPCHFRSGGSSRRCFVLMSEQERLSEGPIGLGLDLERMDDGSLVVRKLQNGGAASLSNQIRVGDKVS